jgi:hypothetical protein
MYDLKIKQAAFTEYSVFHFGIFIPASAARRDGPKTHKARRFKSHAGCVGVCEFQFLVFLGMGAQISEIFRNVCTYGFFQDVKDCSRGDTLKT